MGLPLPVSSCDKSLQIINSYKFSIHLLWFPGFSANSLWTLDLDRLTAEPSTLPSSPTPQMPSERLPSFCILTPRWLLSCISIILWNYSNTRFEAKHALGLARKRTLEFLCLDPINSLSESFFEQKLTKDDKSVQTSSLFCKPMHNMAYVAQYPTSLNCKVSYNRFCEEFGSSGSRIQTPMIELF